MELYSAIIGFIGVAIGAVITGMFQWFTTKALSKQSSDQFKTQMEQTYKEFSVRIEQIQAEQKRVAIEKATEKFHAENDRFYLNLKREIQFYDWLINELHYLNNATHPNNMDRRKELSVYPLIDTRFCNTISDIELPQNIAKLLGALRYNIDVYNVAVESRLSAEVIEDALKRIYVLITPINNERFENYSNALNALRKYEIKCGQETLEKLSCNSNDSE